MNVEPRFRTGVVNPLALAAVLLAACGVYHGKTCLLLVRSGSGNIAGEEMNVIWGLERLMLRGSLYTNPASAPFGIIQYAPIYYRVCARVAALAGVGARDTAGVTALARSVSLACLLGQVVVAGVILRRHLATGWDLVILAGVCLLIVQGVWGVTARPDTMAVLVASLAMLASLESVRAARGDRKEAVVWLTLAVVVSVLAGLVKQNGVEAGLYALPGAAIVLGWRWTASACLLAAIPAALMTGAAFWGLGTLHDIKVNLVDGLNNGANPMAALHLAYLPYLKTMSALLAAGLLAALAPWSRLARRAGGTSFAVEPAELILGWATAASLAFATLTALKFGSAPNYFLLFNLFAVISAARFLETRRTARASAWSWFPALYLVLFLLVQAFETRRIYSTLGDRYSACNEVVRRLRDEMDDDPEGTLFFSIDARLDVLLPDRCALPQKLVAAILHRRGVIDFSGFSRAVADGRVRYCVTYTPANPSQDLAGAIRDFSIAQSAGDPGPDRTVFIGASFARFRPLFRVGAFTVHALPEEDRPGKAER